MSQDFIGYINTCMGNLLCPAGDYLSVIDTSHLQLC